MQILVTGANGFLGYYVVRQLLGKGYNVAATGKGDCRLPFISNNNFQYLSMDFTDPFAVDAVFNTVKPNVVIHAGAMSKPDECEKNQMLAYVVNVEGTVTLLTNAEEHKSIFIFLSTDFIFDGERGMYSEEDIPAPVNYYGKTKLEAEEAVMEYPYDWSIIRTVLVYGKNHSGRNNFISLIKEKLETNTPYGVFDDQQRTPTYVEDLADGIVAVIEKRKKGVYHISGKDILSPYQMAVQAAHFLKADSSLLRKLTASELAEPAKRPPKTGFVIDKAVSELCYNPLSFEEGLKRTFTF